MNTNQIVARLAIGTVATLMHFGSGAQAQVSTDRTLAKSLSLHASFDVGPDADFSLGDRSIWQASTIEKRDGATKGLPTGDAVKLEPQTGRFGGALRFSKSKGPVVFYKAEKNFRMPAPDWSGTVSFWLKTDMANDLNDGFCDPIQITSKQWDDASFFVEFEKRPTGIPFRLGVYADKSVWNPTNRKFEEIPAAERPLITVTKPPFAGDRWTHVAFTFERFNTGKQDGIASLYLNGELQAEMGNRTQYYTWDPSRAAILLGLSYVGVMDDLGLFDRALTRDEIKQVYELKNGLSELTSR